MTPKFEYRVVHDDTGRLQARMNELGAEGFRCTVMERGDMLPSGDYSVLALMERVVMPEPQKPQDVGPESGGAMRSRS